MKFNVISLATFALLPAALAAKPGRKDDQPLVCHYVTHAGKQVVHTTSTTTSTSTVTASVTKNPTAWVTPTVTVTKKKDPFTMTAYVTSVASTQTTGTTLTYLSLVRIPILSVDDRSRLGFTNVQRTDCETGI